MNLGATGLAAVISAGIVPAAAAPPAAAQEPLVLHGPRLVATGAAIELRGRSGPRERVRLEVRVGSRWARVAAPVTDRRGRLSERFVPRRARGRYLLRARTADGRVSRRLRVRSRDLVLAAVGDVNLGDGPALVMQQRGLAFPWTGVGPVLRRADIAFGNLECAVSARGAPVPKLYNFRGSPAALRVMARRTGFDALNLANNHVGDYGSTALLDTVRLVRRAGIVAVGAGGSIASAARPRVVRRLGLRVAFVGFSDILPAFFYAGPRRAGTQQATVPAIRAGVRRARRRADVVVATFHWGVERSPVENERQRAFAAAALGAGADAVIGAHPHVLQPVRRHGRRVVAYSLGNFVFSAGSPGTTATGILRLRLSARGVEGSRLLPAHIENTRPRLLGGR
ncbi:MAG: CapA family protein [Thermoleophilaceae bacterium]|nr:CapA family protein [Thermoleophilaceae bacterium]